MAKIKSPAARTELLNAAADKFNDEHQQAVEAMLKLAPPGTRVSWTTERSGKSYRHYGHVTGIWGVSQFRVQNEATGKVTTQYVGRHGNLRVEA